MSLQVWLPLNGDLYNQGLGDCSITANAGATFYNDGKIGKAINLNKRVNLTSNAIANLSTFSIAFWAKTLPSSTLTGDWMDLIGFTDVSTGGTTGQFRFETRYSSGQTQVGVHWHDNATNALINSAWTPSPQERSVWHHYCVVIKKNEYVKSYLDGVLNTTYTTNLGGGYLRGDFWIGETNNIEGAMNDVRIYDHALSPKEVEEIAKGLVLHYKLDRSTNLAPTTYNYSGWTIGSGWTINGNVASFSRTGATANNWVRLIPPLQINPNNYPNGITVSMDLLTPDKSAINSKRLGALQIYKSNGTRIGWAEPEWNLTNVVDNKWSRISYTFPQSNLKQISDGTSSASDVSYTMFSFQLVQNGNISIKNIQIEDGNKANPYKPADEKISKYDQSIYTEPDGTQWLRIAHHNNPAGGLFSSSDVWANGVYKDANRWFDIYGVLSQVSRYEFMVKQKTTSDATETKYRWIQSVNPLTASYAQVAPGAVTRITTSGYTDGGYGGLYILNSNTHMCIANASNGNWYGAFGCYTAYSGGIPGYPNTTITSGYMDLYVNVTGLDFATEYDCSGYCNNGARIGNLTAAAGSPRYSVSTQFASGSHIRVNKRPAEITAKDAITVSLWINPSSWSNPISCTEGGGWNFENGSSGIRFPIYISGVGYKYLDSTITTSSLLNNWHMLTGTMDANNVKLYLDGVEKTTVVTGSTNGIGYANNYIFIGAEAAGNTGTPANSNYVGKISDVRIYATALTAAQVKELYNTSMSVDSSGNIYARELSEVL